MIDIESVFMEEGPIARRMAGYAYRSAQVDMAYAVADALHAPHHLAVEAPPGMGRRLAYLAAAVQKIDSGCARGVVSLSSPALQRRILAREIPLLQSGLPVEFTAARLQPRHQYVSLRRLEQVGHRRRLLGPLAAQRRELVRLERWARQSSEGSLEVLHPPPDLPLWDRVKSEHGNCMGHRCARYLSCPYHTARRRAHNARLVVVSHAVLLADLSLRRRGSSLLPDYDFVIVDEAEALPAAASEHFGLRFSDRQLGLLLDALYEPHRGGGFLTAFHAETSMHASQLARQAGLELCAALLAWQRDHGLPNGRCASPPQVQNLLSPALRGLHLQLALLRDRLTGEEDLFELTSYMDRCTALADGLEELLNHEREGSAYWMHLSGSTGRQPGVTLCAAPIDVAAELSETLFRCVRSAVLVSPALSLGGADDGLAYGKRRVGLNDGYSLRLERNLTGELLVETHLPLPDLENGFLEAAGPCIRAHVQSASGGAVLVVPPGRPVEALAAALSACGLALRHGGPNTATQQQGGVLLLSHARGTELERLARRWRTLILLTLPFDAAELPLTEARIEAIHARGGHAFREFQLPEAILKFKETVSSWLCTKYEHRQVVLLDQRLASRPYGREFLAALPGCRVLARGALGAAFTPLPGR